MLSFMKARHNLCFAETEQEADYTQGKGTVTRKHVVFPSNDRGSFLFRASFTKDKRRSRRSFYWCLFSHGGR